MKPPEVFTFEEFRDPADVDSDGDGVPDPVEDPGSDGSMDPATSTRATPTRMGTASKTVPRSG